MHLANDGRRNIHRAPALSTRLRQIYEEVWLSPYYRFHPIRTGKLVVAKVVFAYNRIYDVTELLGSWGLDASGVGDGLHYWLPLLEDMLRRIDCRGGQQGSISLEDGVILYTLTRIVRPRRVVETGVAAGASTAFISAALIDNGMGQLHSIELPVDKVEGVRHTDGAKFDWPHYGVAWALPSIIRTQLGNRHTLILEDVRSALPSLLSRLGEVDLFFHDDLHEPAHMLQQYRLVWTYLSSGGFLVSDDINYSWLQFQREHNLSRSVVKNSQRLAAIRKPVESYPQ